MYLRRLGFVEGADEFERREAPGVADIRRIFGVAPICYGQPGSSWAPQTNLNQAILAVDNSSKGSVYTGLAITNKTSGNFLYAADEANGKVDVYDGSFNFVNGVSRNGIARLNPDGSLDTGFDPGSGAIYDDGYEKYPVINFVVLQPDGRILIGGAITSVNGIQHDGIARLNGDFPLEFFPFARPANGPLRLTLATQSSKVYILQTSTDLMNWIPLSTNTASGYTLDFEETNAASFSQRFYRAVAP